jgi:hypothetical protein
LSTTSVSTPKTNASAEARQVLAAYRAGWEAFEQAAATSDAFDPALPATMTDPLLQQVREDLVGDKADGVVTRGAIELHPKLASMTTGVVVVLDCLFSRSELVYVKSGKPVPPVTPPESDGVKATLVRIGSRWKVSQQTVTEGRCALGY